MNDNCNKLINTMIEKGADPKIFDMPAMRERIESGMIKDMSVNSDGTIDFNGYGVRIDIWTHFMRGCIIELCTLH